jgi:hypothetical protein
MPAGIPEIVTIRLWSRRKRDDAAEDERDADEDEHDADYEHQSFRHRVAIKGLRGLELPSAITVGEKDLSLRRAVGSPSQVVGGL